MPQLADDPRNVRLPDLGIRAIRPEALRVKILERLPRQFHPPLADLGGRGILGRRAVHAATVARRGEPGQAVRQRRGRSTVVPRFTKLLATLEKAPLPQQAPRMATVSIELETDAVEKLSAAKLTTEESLSSVVRRAQFPPSPRLARELLADFQQRAGHSPLSDEALDRLAETQRHPTRSPSPWEAR